MTLNSNLIGNLKQLLDQAYPDREKAWGVLEQLAWIIHHHEGDITRHELEALLLMKADDFHVHLVEEILDLKEWTDQYSDKDHRHEDMYLKVEVDSIFERLLNELNATVGLKVDIVDTLPEEGAREGRFYLVPKQTKEGSNTYDEYFYYSGGYEKIDTDLSPLDVLEDYAKVAETAEKLRGLAVNTHTHEELCLKEWFESQLRGKAFTTCANSLQDGLMSKEDYKKLEDIEEGANHIDVELEFIEGSRNPVANSVIYHAFKEIEDTMNEWQNTLNGILEALNGQTNSNRES